MENMDKGIVIKYSGDLGRSWAKIYGSLVGWLKNTRMSTQPIITFLIYCAIVLKYSGHAM